MSKNPFQNAILAAGYIVLVALIMYYGVENAHVGNSVIVPIAMISLFTLSAAVMGYLFVYQPIQMYLDGQKREAAALFTRTVLIFGCITVLVFAALLLQAHFTL